MTNIAIPMIEPVGDPTNLRPAAYLALNSDVRAAEMDALDHYVRYGQAEGRRQLADTTRITQMRREKLAKIQFSDLPRVGIDTDGRLDYLPQELRDSFEIPETPPVAENDYHPEIVALINANPDKIFLDVGAGFRHTYYHNVVNAEIWPAMSTDVLCISEELPFADNSFDYIFCLAVLEHTKRPWVAVREIIRVLKPGGCVRIDWPFLQPFHGYPHHYFNATSKGTISQFEDDCEILSAECKPWQHPIFALAWVLDEWHAGLPEEERAGFRALTVDELLRRPREELLYERFCQTLPANVQDIISAGTTLVARKR